MAFWSKKPGGTIETVASSVGQSVQEQAASSQPKAPLATQPPAQPTARAPDAAATTAASPAMAAPELSPEAKKKAVDASKNLLAAFGQVTSILMRSAQYRKLSLADLEWLVVPAVTNGQFALAEAQSKANGMMVPVGVLLWASVSAEVDKRLTETTEVPMRLKQEEWRSGDILWVIDGVGEQQVIQAMLKRKMETDWAGRPVKMKVRDKTGVMRVGVLSKATPQPAA